MTPINRKEIVLGSRWELRAKLTQETHDNYKTIKTLFQNRQGKTYSDSAFMASLFKHLVTVSELTP